MKIFLFSLMLASVAVSTQAQTIYYQHPNGDFEKTWDNNNEPGNHWLSFKSADGSLAKTANGYLGGYTYKNTTKVTGYNGTGSAVKIVSKYVKWGNTNANGNLTTGCIRMGNSAPQSTENYNRTVTSNDKFSLLFGQPDRVEFDAIFKSGGSPAGRGHFILHGDTDYKDPEDKDQASFKYGEATVYVEDTKTAWKHVGADFTYTKDMTKPQKLYLLASFTTNETAGATANDEFTIDNVKFIYYHGLSALSYNGTAIEGFSENTTEYTLTVNGKFDPNKIKYITHGKGANVSVSLKDENTCEVIVKGEDYDATTNASAITTYTIHIIEQYTYTNDLSVGISDGTNAPSFMTPQSNNIILVKEADGSHTFKLHNFMLGSGPDAAGVGNIELTNLTKTGNVYTAKQNIKITAGDDPNISEWMGPWLSEMGDIPVDLTATANENQMTASIAIDMHETLDQFINVTFAPTTNFKDGNIKTVSGLANITMTRTFKKGWNTVCLPFPTSVFALDKNSNGDGDAVQEFTSADENGLNFTKVDGGKIEANKPYLVYFANEVVYNEAEPLCYGGNLEASTPTPITFGAYTFFGNYTAGMSMDGKYGVATVEGVQKLRIGGANATLPAGCAYFTTNNNANGMLIRLDGGNVTGILDVNTGVVVENAAVYNLQGVKVSNNGTANLPAGIYVMGGKKVVVK